MNNMESKALKISSAVGSVPSLIIHSIFFVCVLVSPLFGVELEKSLLILTTVVSLEAIYLSIFIQMSVNKNTQALAIVEKEIDEMSDDMHEIQEDVEEIQKDVDEIQEDVEEMSEDVVEIQKDVEEMSEDVDEIQKDVEEISEAK
jgi:uncharacterized protein YoxC